MNRHSQSINPAQWIIFALSLGAGFSVAAIYYAQPLLPLMCLRILIPIVINPWLNSLNTRRRDTPTNLRSSTWGR